MVDASRVLDEFNRYMSNGEESWYRSSPDRALPGPIAYFCAEYGIHESMQIYSGGLGVLAGDHCKSASDAALPFIGSASSTGVATSASRSTPMATRSTPSRTSTPDSCRCGARAAWTARRSTSSVEVADRSVHAAVWVAQVGRVPILLLDTDVPANDKADRPITHILYVRGREMRLCQELVLGIGGVRALRALGIDAGRLAPQRGPLRVPADRARARAAGRRSEPRRSRGAHVGSVATRSSRSTPPSRPATRCSRATSSRPPCSRGSRAARMEPDELLELGRGPTDEPNAPFDMTAFVLRHASNANAVSQLHARTATETWQDLAGHPIAGITNGVHVPTWLGRPVRRAIRRAVQVPLEVDLNGPEQLANLGDLDDSELWSAHEQQKREMVGFLEGRLARQLARHGESPTALREVRSVLNAERADHRLRAPLRDLQARGPAVPRRGAPGPASCRRTSARCRS